MKLANLITRLSIHCLPPHRREWGEAMRAELPALPASEALPWALGCLTTACLERIYILHDMSMIGRLAVAALAIGLGASTLHELAEVSGPERVGPFVFLGLQSLIYFVAAFALARKQSRLLIETLVTIVCVRVVFVTAVNPLNTFVTDEGRLPEILGVIVGTFLPTAILALAAAIVWRLPSRTRVAA